MSSSYDIWLTDDAGRRMTVLNNLSGFFSYSRTVNGYGTVQMGIPYRAYKELIPSVFQVDWRLDVWRSPATGYPKRREGSFFLLKHNIYRREDGMEMIEFLGRSPLEILRRMVVGSSIYSSISGDYADDAMKTIVNAFKDDLSWGPSPFTGGALNTSTGEITVDSDGSLGPIVSKEDFLYRKVLDVLKEIRDTTVQMNLADSSNRKIYFDMVEGPGLANGFGYVFRTYADLRGQDRTSGVVFSVENGNLKDPVYYEDYFDNITIAFGLEPGDDGELISNKSSPDRTISRWANAPQVERLAEAGDSAAGDAECYKVLEENKTKRGLNCTFLNTPGGPGQPRSLYGVDWDLGDLLPVQFAGKNLEAEVKIVYVAVNEDGEETITGRNEVGAQ